MPIEIFPVVHVSEVSQTLDQAELSYELGANGVYLIDHHNSDTNLLLRAYNEVAEKNLNRFIGLNFLQLASAECTFSFIDEQFKSGNIARLPDAIWTDDAIRDKDKLINLRHSRQVLTNILYLGGVAFKYTKTYTDNPEQAVVEAKNLMPYVDVVTTSGRGTGISPSPEKIRAMKNAIGDKKLAVASGISIDNIRDFFGLFDQLLVSTSVEVQPYSGIFVPNKLKKLIEIAQTM